ncbi:G5 and 3D domain-containing protein [Chakrabartyella piscis]|uniref:G5 and 3D domain-containing protein n=1 Tax=Chakrabartyella piscis TaxID=2918914 RepID=UPI0029586544|nr:3D domain-containing protein [Chakrabartyella piscis]
MKTHFRVLVLVILTLVIGTVTASASSMLGTQSVVIEMDGVPRMVSTSVETVGEVLEQVEASIEENFFLNDLEEDDLVEDMMTISLTSITEKVVATTETVAYETEIVYNTEMEIGEEVVTQAGKDGVVSNVTKEVYHGKELVSEEFVEAKVLEEVVSEIIEVGTHGVINGYSYTQTMSMKVTAYTPFDEGCNGITSTGTVATKGVLAVDPSVIPYGTRVYIPGYGVAVAEDTGGAIQGNRLDVCYDTKDEAFSWGVRNLTVYILQ